MMQTIEGKRMYIVDLDVMPALPITGLTPEELMYEKLMSRARGFTKPAFDPYYRGNVTGDTAKALEAAITEGVITEPGKYGIFLFTPGDGSGRRNWEVYHINE